MYINRVEDIAEFQTDATWYNSLSRYVNIKHNDSKEVCVSKNIQIK